MLPTPRRRPPVEGAKPPAEVRITGLRAEPLPDGSRVRVHLTLTPFLENPNLEAVLADEAGRELTRATIIENVDTAIVFTLHVRPPANGGAYFLKMVITYPEIGAVDEQTLPFAIDRQPGGDA